MRIVEVLDKLSTARVEYKSKNNSVYSQFVVPTFIDKCDLRSLSHSISLSGSRGCGKTTYIKYFSHWTRFDSKREKVPLSEFDCIVLYWKPDITYCRGLTSNWLGDQSIQFFMLHASIELLSEFMEMVSNCTFHYKDIEKQVGEKQFWAVVSDIAKSKIESVQDARSWIRRMKFDLASRVNDRRVEGMIQIHVSEMLKYLVWSLKDSCSHFHSTKFKIYVDEFELLTSEQQEIINTFRKHSTMEVNWNVAYKANANPSIKTASSEWLQAPDDYREINLDSYIREGYESYAAEIFLLTLQNTGLQCEIGGVSPEFLGDRGNVEERKKKKHRDEVIEAINRILPTPKTKDLSEYAIKQNAVRNQIREAIKSLKLITPDYLERIIHDAELAITVWGIKNQRGFKEADVVGYLDNEDKSKQRMKEKIHNFQYNSLLSLNLQFAYLQIPVYSGFRRFATMSSSNIRYFKELCYNSLRQMLDDEEDTSVNSIEAFPAVKMESMQRGAIATSTAQVKEIVNYPPYGKTLATLVYRLGEIFSISQKSPVQTEPERNIFRIQEDFEGISSQHTDVINSAISWRVLIDQESKRERSRESTTYNREFYLNPIYAPYFGISFRVKRDITITPEEFEVLLLGEQKRFVDLRRHYIKKWKVDIDNTQPDLLL